jgi:membrane dipeptidase
VVAEMNRLGIMIDVSHVSDAAFEQVLALSRAPVIASHSSCRHFTPGWERNMSDEMIRRLGEKDGVIQINFGSSFLTHAAREQSSALWEARDAFKTAEGLEDGDPRIEEFVARYWSERQRIYADVSDVVDHIERVVELAGVDHVGFGSDFDGVGDSLPTGLKDVSYYPNLVDALLERGFSEADVEKICAGNLLRVWSEVRRVASEPAAG